MIIECPSCTKDNEIAFGKNILCNKCNHTFAGYHYKKFKKPFFSATAALIIGATGTYHLDRFIFQKERYPTHIEYELIDLCVNSSRIVMDTNIHNKKTKTCICALNKTMKEFSYREFKKSESDFPTRFMANANICR